MFILATTELQKVPATILSRCQRHSFRRIDAPVIAEYLEYIAKQESFTLSHEAAELIARLAEGGVRDALSLLDQCSADSNIDVAAVYSAMGLAGNRRTAELFDHVLEHRADLVLEEFNALWMDGKDPMSFLGELSGLLRDALIMQVAPKSAMSLASGSFDGETLGSLAKRMTSEEIICAMKTIQSGMAGMKDSPNPKTAAELCLVSLCNDALGESPARLCARISRLEQQIKSGVGIPAPEEWDDEDELESCCPPDEAEYDEDDIDPEAFREEQPEDSFLQRDDKPKPLMETPAADRSDSLLWPEICQRAAETLPMEIRPHVGDGASVRGGVDGGVLTVQVVPGFLFGRFNRPEVVAKLSSIASDVAGRELRVVIAELRDTQRQQRSLDELRQFKEVKFL